MKHFYFLTRKTIVHTSQTATHMMVLIKMLGNYTCYALCMYRLKYRQIFHNCIHKCQTFYDGKNNAILHSPALVILIICASSAFSSSFTFPCSSSFAFLTGEGGPIVFLLLLDADPRFENIYNCAIAYDQEISLNKNLL